MKKVIISIINPSLKAGGGEIAAAVRYYGGPVRIFGEKKANGYRYIGDNRWEWRLA